MRTILLRLGLVGAIGAGAFVLRPFLTGSAGELKVGECFDVPAQMERVEDVQHHPCTDGHTAEVFLVTLLSGADDAAYPADASLIAEADGLCEPAFDAYTGLVFDTDPVWTFGYFYPSPESWENGDRGIICYATRLDEAPSTGSIKRS